MYLDENPHYKMNSTVIEIQCKVIKRFSPKEHFAYATYTESNAYDNSVPSSQVIPPMLHNFVSTFSTIRTMMNIKL